MWVSERTKGQLCCRRRNEPIFHEKFKRRILEMLSKTAIAISSFHFSGLHISKHVKIFTFLILFLEELWQYYRQQAHYHPSIVCVYFHIIKYFCYLDPIIFVKIIQLYQTCLSCNFGLFEDILQKFWSRLVLSCTKWKKYIYHAHKTSVMHKM